MVILSKKDDALKTVSKEEVDSALNKIFAEMTKALEEKKSNKITLDKIDETLDALFEAINQSKFEGKNTKIPDFKRIISGDF